MQKYARVSGTRFPRSSWDDDRASSTERTLEEGWGGEGLGGGEKKGGKDGSQKARREYSGGVKGVEGREEERVSSETSRGRYPVSTAN